MAPPRGAGVVSALATFWGDYALAIYVAGIGAAMIACAWHAFPNQRPPLAGEVPIVPSGVSMRAVPAGVAEIDLEAMERDLEHADRLAEFDAALGVRTATTPAQEFREAVEQIHATYRRRYLEIARGSRPCTCEACTGGTTP